MEWLLDRLNLDQISLLIAGQKILKVVLIFIAVRLSVRVSAVVINKFFEKQANSRFKMMVPKKVTTMSTVTKSVVKYTLYFIGITTILGVLELPVSSLLATAGIGGLAIGFGAQNLVRDIITGFFILFEDQYSVGDYITIDKYSGIVEEIGLRITQIRDFNGDIHIVPNGQIVNVTNHSRGNMRVMFDVSIAYSEDVDRAVEIIQNYLDEYKKEEPCIIEGPMVLGVQELAESSVQLRVWATSRPMEQWRIARELKKGIKKTLENARIEIPYPKIVVINQAEEE